MDHDLISDTKGAIVVNNLMNVDIAVVASSLVFDEEDFKVGNVIGQSALIEAVIAVDQRDKIIKVDNGNIVSKRDGVTIYRYINSDLVLNNLEGKEPYASEDRDPKLVLKEVKVGSVPIKLIEAVSVNYST